MTSAGRLKVLWVSLEWPNSEMHTGGVGRYSYRLASELTSLVDLTVVTLAGAQNLDGATIIEIPRSSNRLERFYLAPIRVRRAVRGMHFDVVHAHGDDWALTSGTPVVRSFYGSALSEARASTGLRKLNHYGIALLEKICARRKAIGLAIAPESEALFGCKYVIPPLARVERGHRPSPPTDRPTVLFIGDFAGRKRGRLVERAVDYVTAASDLKPQLIVVGPATDRGSWTSATWHCSGLTDAEVVELLSESWVLMAPSKYEGFGIPTVEALAVGSPVIASPNPGNAYFLSRSDSNLPLHLVADDADLGAALFTRLRKGPFLLEEELDSADALVSTLLDDADPKRLLEIYAEAIGGRRS